MNSFYEHHKDSINWHYRCFDSILLNGLIQPFQQPERVVGFFSLLREPVPGHPRLTRDIADQFRLGHGAGRERSAIAGSAEGRRDESIDPYFERASRMPWWPS